MQYESLEAMECVVAEEHDIATIEQCQYDG